MPKNYFRLSILALFVSNCGIALALPFSPFDPRSMAMGGAGVAVADPANAVFFNPALLTADPTKKFSLDLPILGGRLYDPGNLRTNATSLSTDISSMTSSISTVQGSITSVGTLTINSVATAQAAQSSLTTLQTQLTSVASNIATVNSLLSSLSNQPIQAELGMAAVVAIPGKDYGLAFYGESWGAVGGVLVYNDSATLSALQSTVSTAATTVSTLNTQLSACIANVANCASINTSGVTSLSITSPTLASRIEIRGVAINEAGFSYSQQQVTNDVDWSWGITPKFMELKMYDLTINPSSSLDGLTSSNYQANYSTLNFDVGIEKNYLYGLRSGLVVKNVIPQSFAFLNNGVATGATLNLQPQVRGGVSYANEWTTIALDADLTRNDPAGLEDPSQYIALGGEVSALGWMQVRAGYRTDMVNAARSVASLGLGLSPRIPFFKPHFDFALTTSPDIFTNGLSSVTQIGFAMKMGINF